MSAAEPGPGRGRGRVRDPERHRATLRATLELLEEDGYDGLTIAAVARRAGVGRQLVYQWWNGDKALLVQEALFQTADAPDDRPGPFASDLRDLVAELVERFAEPAMRRGLPGLIAEMSAREHLRVVAHERYVLPMLERYERVVQGAITRGEVVRGTSASDLFDTLRGAVLFRVQARPDRPQSELVDHLVRLVLDGVAVRR